MKIYVTNNYIDFEAPIHMTEDQREKFIDFMQINYSDIGVREVEEVSKRMGSVSRQMIEWTADDYFALLKADSNEELSRETGRTNMSIIMKRGSFIPEFYSWINLKGYSAPITKKMVNEYLMERGI
ncbi:Hypothetical protein Mbur_2319 [Methanococcoides burtonii DSM 6242]|uniref:Uncharacterized protein n=2 Tax=Methanococcoides burtonii TaxID=29291 RepID=Q12TQ3_METBU|nr:Hypothetical protein Mbur_2319 [Methanococcoides burtonii DSM 6242]